MMKRRRFSLRGILGVVALVWALAISMSMFQDSLMRPVTAVDLAQMRVSFDTADDKSKYVYLSDLALDENRPSRPGWGSLYFDKVDENGTKITLRYEDSVVTMNKGIWAHATSNVYYDLEALGIAGVYDYLTAYVGLNTTSGSGNGVIFWVYGSENGTDWEVIYNEERKVSLPRANADFIKVGIKPYKYLRLQAYDNGGNGNDHAVWGEAKLVKEGYQQYVVPSVADFDNELKAMEGTEIAANAAYELTLLRRSLIRNVGQYAMSSLILESAEAKETIEWLYNDLDVLRYYMTGGKPMGNNYQNSLKVLTRLYQAHKADLADGTVTENGVRRGDLYLRMMIAELLVYSAPVASWIGGGQYSDPVKRYEVFRELYLDGRLDSRVFESLEVEEMRWVLDTMTTDDEVEWLNYYSKKKGSSNPYSYITYRFGYSYGNEQYYSEENREKWNEKYDLEEHNVEYGAVGKPKLWIVFEEGSVCGGLSKTGTNIWNTWGYPASVIGQPGHAAYLYYVQDTEGRGEWRLGNNISGWSGSEKSERLPLGWGSNSWDSYYQVSYVPYAQAALNDMDNYIKAEEELLLADLYGDDYDKLEVIYRKALGYQRINMDAWYGLIQLYNADGRKTEVDFVRLVEEIAEALKYYPLPMWDLTNLVKSHITTAAGQAEFAKAQNDALQAGLVATENEVLQSDITRTMANYLLNNNDLSVAKFSFDGENAGKIVLAERYQDASLSTTWEYSIDGKQTWSQPISEGSWQLAAEEIAKINAENDIVVHIMGTDRDTDSYAIDITTQELPSNFYANDLENRVVGVGDVAEWRMSENEPWTLFAVSRPDLTGEKTVQVRNGATGTKLVSNYATYSFTTDAEDKEKQYIPVEHLSIAGVSSEATNQAGNASNMIDGNYNTRWHSAWNGSDRDKWVTIKFDQPVWLTAMDYVPAGGGNGKILDGEVWGSYDGNEFFKIGEIKNWGNNETVKTLEIQNLEKPVSYVKVVGTRTSTAGGGSFIAGRMFNFYKNSLLEVPEEPEKPGENPGVERPGGGDEGKPDDTKPGDVPAVLPGGNVSGGANTGTGAGNTGKTEVAQGGDSSLPVRTEGETGKNVKVESGRLPLSSSLKEKFGANSEYFDLSFVDENGEKATELPEKAIIKIASGKKLVGVYLVKDDGTTEEVKYERAGNNEIAILSPNTGKYLLDYEDEKGASTVNEGAEEKTEEKKEWYQNWVIWVGIGLAVILVIGIGMSMAENRRR